MQKSGAEIQWRALRTDANCVPSASCIACLILVIVRTHDIRRWNCHGAALQASGRGVTLASYKLVGAGYAGVD
jgi:hypothetical protein